MPYFPPFGIPPCELLLFLLTFATSSAPSGHLLFKEKAFESANINLKLLHKSEFEEQRMAFSTDGG